ncbi:YeeE/YedE family protein [Vibrio marisflavi]|uniref:Sulphur transport domain-containing protein n=1 Tax=Vibrio marisflavi CECT 7928 TaxID=634439 RepID=A0ABM9A1N7_9VIBR|nr:YeeE/YedE family protein [Vibrio marisflavi]CAH0537784.1 hypothetical protein VMF7928_01337 [Vibrio marisflavi CECT 7928]
MTSFTPEPALIGGLLIGAAALLLLVFHGKVLGISGIVSNSFTVNKATSWRRFFLIGLAISPFFISDDIAALPTQISISWPEIVLGGFLVGFGTKMGSGCTSGHGVCGIGRLSIRSIVATCTFVFTAVVVVFFTRHIKG